MDWSQTVLFIPLFVVYCSIFVISSDDIKVTTNYDLKKEQVKFMNFKQFNVFSCEVTSEHGKKHSIKWKKDGPDGRSNDIAVNNNRVKVDNNQLKVFATRREDLTNYTCEILDENKNIVDHKTFFTYALPYAKIQVLSNPIDEGDTIKLECDIWGNPVITVEWKKDEQTIPREESGRYNISDNMQKGIVAYSLTIDNAELTDRGIYSCTGENTYGNHTAKVMVRVKDKLAALWPFIGICAEVFVLCTVIFIYERKRNKSELDESDTDQSPEQKNTPDHGKESVRQRK